MACSRRSSYLLIPCCWVYSAPSQPLPKACAQILGFSGGFIANVLTAIPTLVTVAVILVESRVLVSRHNLLVSALGRGTACAGFIRNGFCPLQAPWAFHYPVGIAVPFLLPRLDSEPSRAAAGCCWRSCSECLDPTSRGLMWIYTRASRATGWNQWTGGGSRSGTSPAVTACRRPAIAGQHPNATRDALLVTSASRTGDSSSRALPTTITNRLTWPASAGADLLAAPTAFDGTARR